MMIVVAEDDEEIKFYETRRMRDEEGRRH